jgi:hypothetical protein
MSPRTIILVVPAALAREGGNDVVESEVGWDKILSSGTPAYRNF